MGFCGIHLWRIAQEVLKISICKMSLENTLAKLLLHLPRAYVLMAHLYTMANSATQMTPKLSSMQGLGFQKCLWACISKSSQIFISELTETAHQCKGKIFCVEFQMVPLKFHTKYLTHTLKDTIFIQCWQFKLSDLRAHTRFWTSPHPHPVPPPD